MGRYPEKYQVWREEESGKVLVLRTIKKSGAYARMWHVQRDGTLKIHPVMLVNVVRLMRQEGYTLLGKIAHEGMLVPEDWRNNGKG